MKSGYVLDFSNRTFEGFLRVELGVEIYGGKYDFEGTSKGSHLRAFLKVSRPADVARALTALWEYREDRIRREGSKDDVPDALPRLNKLLARLGGPAIADGTAPPAPARAPTVIRPSVSELQDLRDAFVALHPLVPQPRGVAFEKFLSKFFDAWGLEARGSFKNRGEQNRSAASRHVSNGRLGPFATVQVNPTHDGLVLTADIPDDNAPTDFCEGGRLSRARSRTVSCAALQHIRQGAWT